jgi:hypothetical protein
MNYHIFSPKPRFFNNIPISLTNSSYSPNLSETASSIRFHYPCSSPTTCTSYEVILPAGRYSFLVCGANGGVLSSYYIPGQKIEEDVHQVLLN